MKTLATQPKRWLGIDFSGDHNRWRPGCRKSNVWIADVGGNDPFVLCDLRSVQQLPGNGTAFHRLTALLRNRQFDAAAIDAPFSVPAEFVPAGDHRKLLEFVSEIRRPVGRSFPMAGDFADGIVAGRTLSTKKPLRETEKYWRRRGVHVRSTLRVKERGGGRHDVGLPHLAS